MKEMDVAEDLTLLALFEDIDPAADAIDKLRELGVDDSQINCISGIPVLESMLGRPHQKSNVPRLARGGAIAGLMVGIFLAFITSNTYPIYVGGQPLAPAAPSIVVIFEMIMLGLLIATFVGVFLDSRFPSYSPKEYIPEISDGAIALLFTCPPDEQERFMSAMTSMGAEKVEPAEAQRL
jgi:hypothetical protein